MDAKLKSEAKTGRYTFLYGPTENSTTYIIDGADATANWPI